MNGRRDRWTILWTSGTGTTNRYINQSQAVAAVLFHWKQLLNDLNVYRGNLLANRVVAESADMTKQKHLHCVSPYVSPILISRQNLQFPSRATTVSTEKLIGFRFLAQLSTILSVYVSQRPRIVFVLVTAVTTPRTTSSS